MKKIIALGMFILCTQPFWSQEHAPALQTWVADLNLWTSEFPDWPKTTNAKQTLARLSITEILPRIEFINKCYRSYPVLRNHAPDEVSAADSLMTMYEAETGGRALSFISRHHLEGQFAEEDSTVSNR